MTRLLPIIIAGGLAGLALGVARADPVAAPSPASPADPVAGQSRYMRVGCAQCHGTVGQGGNAGPALIGTPLSPEGFARQLRRPVNNMPPYTRAVLSDRDVRDIDAWVRTLKP